MKRGFVPPRFVGAAGLQQAQQPSTSVKRPCTAVSMEKAKSLDGLDGVEDKQVQGEKENMEPQGQQQQQHSAAAGHTALQPAGASAAVKPPAFKALAFKPPGMQTMAKPKGPAPMNMGKGPVATHPAAPTRPGIAVPKTAGTSAKPAFASKPSMNASAQLCSTSAPEEFKSCLYIKKAREQL